MNQLRLSVSLLMAAQLWTAGAGAQQASPARSTAPVKGGQLPAASQGPHVSHVAPDYIIYMDFFAHVERLDQRAEQLEAEGKNGKGLRTHDQRAAGLTDEEGAIIKQVAYACNIDVRNASAQFETATKQVRASGAQAGGTGKSQSPGVQQAIEERNAAVESHIAQLREMLGEASFQKLDKYAHSINTTTTQVSRPETRSKPIGPTDSTQGPPPLGAK